MGRILRAMATACGIATGACAWAEVTFFEHDDFRGRSFTVTDAADNFARHGFNDRASSAIVRRGAYQVCEHAGYEGRCVTLGPGNYGSLRSMGLNNRVSSARAAGRRGGGARAVLYSQPNFGGSRVVLDGDDIVGDFAQSGFNDRASSLRVERGHWMLCSRAGFRGECRTFGPGDYHHLPRELDNRVSSVRPLDQRHGDRPGRESRYRD